MLKFDFNSRLISDKNNNEMTKIILKYLLFIPLAQYALKIEFKSLINHTVLYNHSHIYQIHANEHLYSTRKLEALECLYHSTGLIFSVTMKKRF